MPFGWAAGAAVVGAGISAIGASSAADTQANAQQQATQAQLDMFNQTTTNLAPFLKAGTNAIPGLVAATNTPQQDPTQFAGPFGTSPGYKFQLQQGIDAVQNQASTLGGIGGNALKALDTYGQGVANQDFWNQYGAYLSANNTNYQRQQNLVATGQNAAVQQGGFAQQTGQGIASSLAAQGNALAAGQVGISNALNQGLNNASAFYLQQNQNAAPGFTGGNFTSPYATASAPGYATGSYYGGYADPTTGFALGP